MISLEVAAVFPTVPYDSKKTLLGFIPVFQNVTHKNLKGFWTQPLTFMNSLQGSLLTQSLGTTAPGCHILSVVWWTLHETLSPSSLQISPCKNSFAKKNPKAFINERQKFPLQNLFQFDKKRSFEITFFHHDEKQQREHEKSKAR